MNNTSKAKFIEWWRTTVRGSDTETQQGLRWDAKHISDIVENFDQIAHYVTGEHLVICRFCGGILPHLNAKQSGANTLKRRITSGISSFRGLRANKRHTLLYLGRNYRNLNSNDCP